MKNNVIMMMIRNDTSATIFKIVIRLIFIFILYKSFVPASQIASVITLPFDVVKTRRQVELGELQAKKC